MAAVFECKMTKTVTVNIKADSAEGAQEWIDTHNFDDVEKLTTMYDTYYEDIVVCEVDETHAIDISEEE